jgi:hypothetical protein
MKNIVITTLVLSSLIGLVHAVSATDALVPQPPMELSGTQGKFDFIKVDSARNRLLACHTQNGSLDVIDLTSGKLVKSVATGNAQGVAIDDKSGRYFVSCSKPPKMVVVDSAKLGVAGEVALPEAADLVAYSPVMDRAYVCNDEKPEMWVIDPNTKQILSTLTFPGAGMEDLGFNDEGTVLFQCLKESSQLAKIDLKEGKIVTQWPTAPVEKPHGLAMVPGTDSVLVVGGNGKLVLMSLSTGQVIASTDVSPRIDEIAYDPELRRVYCASGLGTISVVSLEQNKLTTLAPLPSSQGAHSIAVDPKTHAVWIVFAKDGKAYVQSFTTK